MPSLSTLFFGQPSVIRWYFKLEFPLQINSGLVGFARPEAQQRQHMAIAAFGHAYGPVWYSYW